MPPRLGAWASEESGGTAIIQASEVIPRRSPGRRRRSMASSPSIFRTASYRCRESAYFTGVPTCQQADKRSGLPVDPDSAVEHLELGVVDVALHPQLGHAVERRAGDRVPVELVGAELLELLGDCLALARVHLARVAGVVVRSEEHTSELQSLRHLVCRLLL